MYLYKRIPNFDSRTGKPLPPTLTKDHKRFICDYTGELIDTDADYEDTPLYEISLRYDHSSEPLWDQDAYAFEKDFKIDYSDFGAFIASPFHFKNTEGFGCKDASQDLIEEWMKNRKKLPWKNCTTLEQALRVARLRTLRKLLESKQYTLEDLGFEGPE